MKKILIFLVFLYFTENCFSQSIECGTLIIDTIWLKEKIPNEYYLKMIKTCDSLSKIKIEPDTNTMYKIDKIEEDEKLYIIYARGKAKDDNEYQYRIKSEKTDSCSCNDNQIKVGESYQLDIRLYDNHKLRLHFKSDESFVREGHFDTVLNINNILNNDYFNIALNLKGLCLIKKKG